MDSLEKGAPLSVLVVLMKLNSVSPVAIPFEGAAGFSTVCLSSPDVFVSFFFNSYEATSTEAPMHHDLYTVCPISQGILFVLQTMATLNSDLLTQSLRPLPNLRGSKL